MALREEFEFIAYRCCYCHYWNPARKQKPTAPRLEASALLRPQVVTESSSDEEGNSFSIFLFFLKKIQKAKNLTCTVQLI